MVIRISAPSSMLLANVLGALGLIAIVLAVGGLCGVWWAVLAGGLFAVGVSLVGMSHAAAAEQTAQKPASASVSPVRAVEEPIAA